LSYFDGGWGLCGVLLHKRDAGVAALIVFGVGFRGLVEFGFVRRANLN